jgi:hypothetical protein
MNVWYHRWRWWLSDLRCQEHRRAAVEASRESPENVEAAPEGAASMLSR